MIAPPSTTHDPKAVGLVNSVAWLLEHGLLGHDATGAVIGVTTEHDTLWLIGTTGDLPPITTTTPLTLPLTADLPLCRTARSGQPDCLPTPDAVRRHSPWLAAFAPTASAAVTAPLRSTGRCLGVIGVTHANPATGRRHHLHANLVEIGDHLGTLISTGR